MVEAQIELAIPARRREEVKEVLSGFPSGTALNFLPGRVPGVVAVQRLDRLAAASRNLVVASCHHSAYLSSSGGLVAGEE